MKRISTYLIILFIGVLLAGCHVTTPNQYNQTNTKIFQAAYYEAVDGDTVKLMINGEVRTVRFLAVDCPESVHPTKEVEAGGLEASDFTKNLLSKASEIEIEFDRESDNEDKYGRLLAWLWVDGELIQEKLIANGHAEIAYLYGDYKYIDRLRSVGK